jgi:histone acetyltransferase (RNA polymerase elongator complex component)
MKQSKVLKALGLTSQDIQNMLMNGYTMPEIAKKYKIEYISLVQAYKVQKKNYKYIDYIQPKEEVKDIKNVSFAFDKLYTEESLNEEELLAYYKYEAKNKAYYGTQ